MCRRGGLLAGLLLLAFVPVAEGVITNPLPLRLMISDAPFIVMAKVESVDGEKLGVVVVVDDDLKGKFPVRRLPINMTGDSDAKKNDHTKQILKRLAPKLPLILFVSENDNRYSALAYSNGTWFHLMATKAKDVEKTVFAFTHGEPYLRRSFKGTTEDLKKTLVDAIAGKAKPPELNIKEQPGFGPEVEPEKQGARVPAGSGVSIFIDSPFLVLTSVRNSVGPCTRCRSCAWLGRHDSHIVGGTFASPSSS
jgi:hypothetical protein